MKLEDILRKAANEKDPSKIIKNDDGSESIGTYGSAYLVRPPAPIPKAPQVSSYVNSKGQRIFEGQDPSGGLSKYDRLRLGNSIGTGSTVSDVYKSVERNEGTQGNQALQDRALEIARQSMYTGKTSAGQDRTGSTLPSSQQIRTDAQNLANQSTAGMGEDNLKAMMNAISQQQEKLKNTLKSEGVANTMNQDYSATFGGQDNTDSIIDQVRADREAFTETSKRKDILEKQLGLQEEALDDQQKIAERQYEEQRKDLERQQANAQQTALEMFFGGQGRGTLNTATGAQMISAREGDRFQRVIDQVKTARQDQLRAFDRAIRSNDISAEAAFLNFNLQERTAITNEVQRRMNQDKAVLQDILNGVDLTNLDNNAIMGISEAYGVSTGSLFALKAVQEQQGDLANEATFAELEQKVLNGEASLTETDNYYKTLKLKQESEKLQKEITGEDEEVIIGGVNYTQLTKAAELAKKYQDLGVSSDIIGEILSSAGVKGGTVVNLGQVEKIMGIANEMKDASISDSDIKMFIDSGLKGLGLESDVQIQQSKKEQLELQKQELEVYEMRKKQQGYLSPMDELEYKTKLQDYTKGQKELYGDVVVKSKTGLEFQPDGTLLVGDATERPNGKQCGGFVNDALGLEGVERMGDTLQSKIDSPSFMMASEGAMPEVGGYFVMDLGTEEGHTGIVTGVFEDGIQITDYNRTGKQERRDAFVPYESSEYQKMIGFGKPTARRDDIESIANSRESLTEIKSVYGEDIAKQVGIRRAETPPAVREEDRSVAEAYLKAFNSGASDYDTILTKIGTSNDAAPIKNEFARLVAQQDGKRVVPIDSKMVQDADRLIENLEKLLEDKNLGKISGRMQGGLAGTGFGRSFFTPGAADAFSLVNNIYGNSALNALLQAKADGATFGALSNQELNVLGSSANNLTSRIVVDRDSGRILRLEGTEEAIKNDILSLLEQMKEKKKRMTASQTEGDDLEKYKSYGQTTTALTPEEEAEFDSFFTE